MEFITVERYGRKRRLYKHACVFCGDSFYVRSNDKQKYCSVACRGKAQQKREQYSCANCHKIIYRNPAEKQRSKSGLLFCSKTCKNIAQRIEGISAIHPSHYGNGLGNYREKALRANGNVCEDCGISTWLDIPLLMDVHHIDGNRNNNELSNLKVVCPNCHRIIESQKWIK